MKIPVTMGCAMALMLGVLATWAASQGLPELLIPVSQDAIAKCARPQNFDLREVLYDAKPWRYKIVKINVELLKQENATFTITPLPDDQITLQAKEIALPLSKCW
jgi:hypothetical protein